jgi:hypothetical protein
MQHTHKKTPWFLVRKRTMPIERSPPVSEEMQHKEVKMHKEGK